MVIITTEIHYCSAVSRNYGGKTKEIIIKISLFPRCSRLVWWHNYLNSYNYLKNITLPQMFKTVGWRVVGCVMALYGGVYAYERITWTNKAQVNIFNTQA